MAWTVRYINSGSCDLYHPLKDGRYNFVAGVDYIIENYNDFVRLTCGGDFEEVKQNEPEVVKPEESTEVEVPVEEPKIEPTVIEPVVTETYNVISPSWSEGAN